MSTSRTDVRPGGTASWLSVWATRHPDQPCVIFQDDATTWGAFERAVNWLAASLRDSGVGQGDRVGCLMPNRTEYLMTFWATLRLGALFVPCNVRLTPPELAAVLDDFDPAVVVSDGSFQQTQASIDKLRPVRWLDVDTMTRDLASSAPRIEIPWLAGDDAAAIVYTSGTTGRSKGAVLTHGNFLHQSLSWTSGFGLTGRDIHLHVLPLCYSGGLLSTTLNVFQTGATVVLEPRFDAESALRRIERHRASWLGATPQLIERILAHPLAAETDLSSLPRIETGGSPVPTLLAELAGKRGIALIQGYGLTEATGGVNLFLPPEDAIRKAGAVGRAAPYDAVRIVDDAGADAAAGEFGEMLLRGPLVMKEYWRNPAATEEALSDGWLHTGDLGRMDDEGFVTLAGRKKEMIISGGLNVYPVEVEQVLETFPEIAEVAVVGLPDDEWGERVSAFVILEPGATLSEEELIERVRPYLAGYRIPRIVRFVDDLPRTTSGKVLKRELISRWGPGGE